MTVHPQFEEDLALYALGELQGEDRIALEKHLEDCASCRRELEQLRGDMALLALSPPESRPPRRARERLMNAISREPRRAVVSKPRKWWGLIPYFAAAVLALVAVVFSMENRKLHRQLADLRASSAEQHTQLEQVRRTLATLTSPDTIRVTLVAVKAPPQPQGKAFYLRRRGTLIFLANNLPQLPSEKAYELWLIPRAGAPLPAGVFKPDAHGSASVVNPPLPAGIEPKAFAITVEPEQGSPAPTSAIIMIGTGE
jgi:anti-sigma-K factor RskA